MRWVWGSMRSSYHQDTYREVGIGKYGSLCATKIKEQENNGLQQDGGSAKKNATIDATDARRTKSIAFRNYTRELTITADRVTPAG